MNDKLLTRACFRFFDFVFLKWMELLSMVRFVGIAGSLRPDSYSQHALELAAQRLEALGAEVELLDLRKMDLPFCDGSKEYPDYPDVKRLQAAFQRADGMILATPEYHGSVSGVLKNALDLMSFDQLSGKVGGLISVLGGQPNSNALNDLRTILRWVHAWVIPDQVAIAQAWKAFDSTGNLVDPKLSERFDHFVESLYESTKKLRGAEDRELAGVK
jgi:FMN reductase